MKYTVACLLAVVLLAIVVKALPANSNLEENENLNEMHREKRGLAEICKKLKGWTGWGCDDPVSRRLWRTIHGVSDCNGFCKKLGKSGGSCKSTGNYDTSTWCPKKGQACICN
jgi:hypothetical protein